MACDLLDIKCIFMNELIGSTILTVIFLAVLYFIVASKLKLGFDTTIAFLVPVMLIVALAFTGFSALYAFAAVLVGLMLAWIFQSIIKN